MGNGIIYWRVTLGAEHDWQNGLVRILRREERVRRRKLSCRRQQHTLPGRSRSRPQSDTRRDRRCGFTTIRQIPERPCSNQARGTEFRAPGNRTAGPGGRVAGIQKKYERPPRIACRGDARSRNPGAVATITSCVRGPRPDRAHALALASYWSLIRIGSRMPVELEGWRISTREFREDLKWAIVTPGEGGHLPCGEPVVERTACARSPNPEYRRRGLVGGGWLEGRR